MEVRCPAGQTTHAYKSNGKNRRGQFQFSQTTCQACPLRGQCVRGQGGRLIMIQPQERLQQEARTHNQTEAGRQSLRERGVMEHRIARLVQLGIRQSRYVGKKKSRWQVVMAAGVANLSLVAGYVQRKLHPPPALAAPGVEAAPDGLVYVMGKFLQRVFGLYRPLWG